MVLVIVALKLALAGLLGYGLMLLLMPRISPGVERGQAVRIVRNVGLAAALGVALASLI